MFNDPGAVHGYPESRSGVGIVMCIPPIPCGIPGAVSGKKFIGSIICPSMNPLGVKGNPGDIIISGLCISKPPNGIYICDQSRLNEGLTAWSQPSLPCCIKSEYPEVGVVWTWVEPGVISGEMIMVALDCIPTQS